MSWDVENDCWIGRPYKLKDKDGNEEGWGVIIVGPESKVQVDDEISVSSKGGNQWTTTVAKVRKQGVSKRDGKAYAIVETPTSLENNGNGYSKPKERKATAEDVDFKRFKALADKLDEVNKNLVSIHQVLVDVAMSVSKDEEDIDL